MSFMIRIRTVDITCSQRKIEENNSKFQHCTIRGVHPCFNAEFYLLSQSVSAEFHTIQVCLFPQYLYLFWHDFLRLTVWNGCLCLLHVRIHVLLEVGWLPSVTMIVYLSFRLLPTVFRFYFK